MKLSAEEKRILDAALSRYIDYLYYDKMPSLGTNKEINRFYDNELKTSQLLRNRFNGN
ncbi:hypothetical protein [Brevibacillus reuszeri]|uniref:hypothetical protein n=1 Tax=Brevibacillus reuszeri TaxID=54915 RepID=UPI0013DFEB42|nr:hypothetical protein [Brevibacillus reuszeri]